MSSAGERPPPDPSLKIEKRNMKEKIRYQKIAGLVEELSNSLPWNNADGPERSKRAILEKAIRTMKLRNTPAQNPAVLDTASNDGNQTIMPAGNSPPRNSKKGMNNKLREQYIAKLINELSKELPWTVADGPERSKRTILEKAIQTMKQHNTPVGNSDVLDIASNGGTIMPAGERPPRLIAAHKTKKSMDNILRELHIAKLINELSKELPWNDADGPERTKKVILEKAIQTMKLHNTPAGNSDVLDTATYDGNQSGN